MEEVTSILIRYRRSNDRIRCSIVKIYKDGLAFISKTRLACILNTVIILVMEYSRSKTHCRYWHDTKVYCHITIRIISSIFVSILSWLSYRLLTEGQVDHW